MPVAHEHSSLRAPVSRETRSNAMDNLAKLVTACQQYQEGVISKDEWGYKMIELLSEYSDDDVIAICSVITQYAIHLRVGH
jgi:hypothetical protein